MRKAPVAPILPITAIVWLGTLTSLRALSEIPSPNHDWTIGSGRLHTGFVEYPMYGSNTRTFVYIGGRPICHFDRPIEMVAGGFSIGLLALGCAAGLSIRSVRTRHTGSNEPEP